MAGTTFVVMAKPVGSRCNMRCAYCYYLDKGKYSAHAKQTRMSCGLLEKLIRQAAEDCEGDVVSFIWHGGEPTLAGLDFYRKAVELQRRYLPKGKQVWNNLQTNGLLLNAEWRQFLKENRFDVGISLDGSQAVHDVNRRDLGGQPTWDRVVRNIRRLRECGVEPDLLCTVNAETVKKPLETYRALRDTGCGWVQFIPVVVRLPDGSFDPRSVASQDYGKFLIAVFDEWVSHDLGRLDVQLFAETARVMAGGEASLCWMRPTCGQALVAEEDGSIYSCDHFVDPDHRLGNLAAHRLGSLAGSGAQRDFGDRKAGELTGQCWACPHLRFCNGGCPKDRWEDGQYRLCLGLRMFFDHAVPILERVMAMSAGGKAPGEIMKRIQGETRIEKK